MSALKQIINECSDVMLSKYATRELNKLQDRLKEAERLIDIIILADDLDELDGFDIQPFYDFRGLCIKMKAFKENPESTI